MILSSGAAFGKVLFGGVGEVVCLVDSFLTWEILAGFSLGKLRGKNCLEKESKIKNLDKSFVVPSGFFSLKINSEKVCSTASTPNLARYWYPNFSRQGRGGFGFKSVSERHLETDFGLMVLVFKYLHTCMHAVTYEA